MPRETKPKPSSPKVTIKILFGLIEGTGDGVLGIAAFVLVVFAVLVSRFYGVL